ncbi:MAG: hypothetical protein JWN04_5313 [Myxococcaceae bacterium]|nr:hypothetical protein [Myxococcaceae bacterium]
MLDGSFRDAFVLDGGPGDAHVLPSEHPALFQIRFDTSQCYGDCPSFSVSVDQAGIVKYRGGLCTAQPGVFTKQVPAADVEHLYTELRNAGYWGLNDRYHTVQDGCANVYEDNSTQSLSVSADGFDKRLRYQLSCTGIPALDAVTALAPEVQKVAQIEAWISDQPSGREPINCGAGYEFALEFTGSYRLAQGERAIGVLTLAGSRKDWKLVDCSGQPLSMGTPVMEPQRWLLLDQGERPISLWPDAGTVGSIVLYSLHDGGWRRKASVSTIGWC